MPAEPKTSTLKSIRRLLGRVVLGTAIGVTALHLVQNQKAKIRLWRGNIDTTSGMAHAGASLNDSIDYIERVHREYLVEAGLDRFHGRVAEVGPGDNCGVALLMLADGADHVDLVDRFYSRRDNDQHTEIYQRIVSSRPELHAHRDARSDNDFKQLARRYGADAAAETFFIDNRDYDFIVSRAVMEHVADPLLSLRHMAAALKPGGYMLHAVDLRDHGMYSMHGFHELKFLEIPVWLYREMVTATGLPNRVPVRAYRSALPTAVLKVTGLVGVGMLDQPTLYEDIPKPLRRRALEEVRKVRPRLARNLRDERDEDLSVSSFFLTYIKPATPRAGAAQKI